MGIHDVVADLELNVREHDVVEVLVQVLFH
jgi:hypothetical protein